MAKLAIFTSDFIHKVYSSTRVETTTYDYYLHSLEEWALSLPPSLHRFQGSPYITQESSLPLEDEFASVRYCLLSHHLDGC